MADALGELSFTEKAFGLAHFFLKRKEVFKDGLYLGFGHSAGFVGLYGLMELTGTEFHVVEVRDGLSKGVRDVGEHCLKRAESLSGIVGVFRIYGFIGEGALDEDGNAPILLAVYPVSLAGFLAGDEGKGHLAFLPDMGRGAVYFVLQKLNVLENGVVDSLENVIVGAVCLYKEGVVDETVAKGLDLLYIAFNGKKFYYFKWFHCSYECYLCKVSDFSHTKRFGFRKTFQRVSKRLPRCKNGVFLHLNPARTPSRVQKEGGFAPGPRQNAFPSAKMGCFCTRARLASPKIIGEIVWTRSRPLEGLQKSRQERRPSDSDAIRTRDPQLRRLLLYPAELRNHPLLGTAKLVIFPLNARADVRG